MNLFDLEKKLRSFFNQGAQAVGRGFQDVAQNVGRGAQQVGNYVQQDFNKSPQVQGVNNIIRIARAPQVQQAVQQTPIKISNAFHAAPSIAIKGINTVGKAIGNQNITPFQLKPFVPDINLRDASKRFNLASDIGDTPLTSLLSGQVQKIPEFINKSAKQYNEEQKYFGYTGNDPLLRAKQNKAIGGMVGSINIGGFSKPELSRAADYLTKVADKDAITKISDFVIDVQKTGGKKNYGKLGLEMHAIARDVFGDNARNLSNKQLANVLDATLKNVGRQPNRFNLGLAVDDVRGGKKNVAGVGEAGVRAKPITKEAIKLADAIDHPDLFKKYPEFQNIDFRLTNSTTGIRSGGAGGAYYPGGNGRIEIGKEGWDLVNGKKQLNKTGISRLFHEIEHAKQAKAGISLSPDERELAAFQAQSKYVERYAPQPQPNVANAGLYDIEAHRFVKDGSERRAFSFYTNEKSHAQNYGKDTGEPGKVISEKLNFKKPLIVPSETGNLGNYGFEREWLMKAKDEGYDGVIFRGNDAGTKGMEYYAKVNDNYVAQQPIADMPTPNIRSGRIVPGVGNPTAEGTLGLKSNPQPKGAGLQSNILSGDISGSQTPSSQKFSKPVDNIKLTQQGQAGKPRGLITSVQEAPNVLNQTKAKVGSTYIPKSNKQLMGEAQALLQEGAKLDLKHINNADQKVAATIQEAISQQKKNPKLAADLFNNLSEQGTELGRGVQAFSLLDKMSPEAIALSAAGKIKAYNRTATRKIPELSGEQVKLITDKVSAISKLETGSREHNIAVNELSKTINEFIPSSITDKAITVWKAGLLTSLRTHERNILGNSIMGGAEVAKDVIASPIDRLMALRTGQRSLTLNTQGTAGGVKKGLVAAKDIVQRGYDPEQTIAKFDQKSITWGKNPLEQALKKGTDAVFRTLGGEDKPFLHGATARSLYDQAKAAAINAGKGGDQRFIENMVANPTEQMIKIAEKDANYATFHDKNVLSEVANSIKRAAQNPKYGKWGEFGKAVTEVLAPFTGVPSSIVGKTIDYSPLGLAKGTINVGRVLAGNMPELQRQAAQEIGRGVIGTGLFGIGAYLASKGLLTGQPKDTAESNLWAAQGKQANSVLIDGKWRSINSIGPQNLVMLAGGKYQEEMSKPDGSVGGFAGSIGKDQLNQTFLAGVQGPLNAITDPARYGQSYVGNQLSSTVPNIVKDTSKAFDPYQRENNTISDYFTNSIPGLRNQNVTKRDVLGNVMKQEPTGPAAYYDLFNSKTPIKNDVVDELARLSATDNSATPGKIQKTQTINGQKQVLNPQQLDAFEAKVGEKGQQALSELFKTPEYMKLSDEEKAKEVDSVLAKVRKEVRGGSVSTTKSSKIKTKAKKTSSKKATAKKGKKAKAISIARPKSVKLNFGASKFGGGRKLSAIKFAKPPQPKIKVAKAKKVKLVLPQQKQSYEISRSKLQGLSNSFKIV